MGIASSVRNKVSNRASPGAAIQNDVVTWIASCRASLAAKGGLTKPTVMTSRITFFVESKIAEIQNQLISIPQEQVTST